MIVPYILFLASTVGLGFSLLWPGQSDFVMLAGPMLLGSLWLLLPALLGRKPAARDRVLDGTFPRKPSINPFSWRRPKWIVVDGSNVMHWRDGKPQIGAVQDVVAMLTNLGYSPGVVFDANAGHKLLGRYKHDFAFGKLLGLPQNRVMVVNKGEPADPTILAAARDLGARIVTNDRFRDWAESHPEVATPGHLIRGGYNDGQLWLDMAEAKVTARAS